MSDVNLKRALVGIGLLVDVDDQMLLPVALLPKIRFLPDAAKKKKHLT